ncbi:MAG: hypothetical protein R2706_07685 [Acidimicrobiales bacterium]
MATTAELDAAIAAGAVAVTDDYELVMASEAIDAVLEVTGSIHYAGQVVVAALAAGKHVIMMNAELDGTVGPILKTYADRAGVVLSTADGDQPGVLANLIRFVTSIGLEPLVAGNIKGLQDVNRTPETQRGFAEQWGQNVNMVTSFADGTRISFEQAIVANAFGMTVAKRGMNGANWTDHIDKAMALYDVDELVALGGVVDYVVGAQPGPGVYVFARHEDPLQQHYLNLYKLGTGPLYSFYTPYHLCHFEAPLSVARAVLLGDSVMSPRGGPLVDVVAIAKTDLAVGTVLDGLGGFHTYGEAERYAVSRREALLPIGLAEGCTMIRPVQKGSALSYADVSVPTDASATRFEPNKTSVGPPERLMRLVGFGEPIDPIERRLARRQTGRLGEIAPSMAVVADGASHSLRELLVVRKRLSIGERLSELRRRAVKTKWHHDCRVDVDSLE